MGKYLISFSGCGGAYIALLTAFYKFKDEILQNDPDAKIDYAGISGGIVAAHFAIGGYTPQQAKDICLTNFGSQFTKWKSPIFHSPQAYRKLLNEFIPNSVDRYNDHFHIGVSSLTRKGLKFEVVSKYENKQHLIETSIAAITTPPFSFQLVHRVRGFGKTHFYFDGGIFYSTLGLPGYDKIYDIDLDNRTCPLSFKDYVPPITEPLYSKAVVIGDQMYSKVGTEKGVPITSFRRSPIRILFIITICLYLLGLLLFLRILF